jgi:hypothetical protein
VARTRAVAVQPWLKRLVAEMSCTPARIRGGMLALRSTFRHEAQCAGRSSESFREPGQGEKIVESALQHKARGAVWWQSIYVTSPPSCDHR